MGNEFEGASAYPLQWPAGWPRTRENDRKFGRFNTKGHNSNGWRTTSDITISQALSRINSEIESMDGPGRNWSRVDPDSIVVSTNLRVRKGDGQPASNQTEPQDPGAAVYFLLDGKNQCIPCDSYTKVSQNLAGIAATLSALRALERHGSGLMERAFTGFEALPNPQTTHWRDVLGYQGTNLKEAKAAYLKAARKSHPDHGGNLEQSARVNAAWELCKQELSA
ncbi:MAG: J domain-containing protein [Gammaproteobacteria bacterium]